MADVTRDDALIDLINKVSTISLVDYSDRYTRFAAKTGDDFELNKIYIFTEIFGDVNTNLDNTHKEASVIFHIAIKANEGDATCEYFSDILVKEMESYTSTQVQAIFNRPKSNVIFNSDKGVWMVMCPGLIRYKTVI